MFLAAQGNVGVRLQPAHHQTSAVFSVLQSPQGEVYSHHSHSICNRLKNCTRNSCCCYLESEHQPTSFCSLLLLKTCFRTLFWEPTTSRNTLITEVLC